MKSTSVAGSDSGSRRPLGVSYLRWVIPGLLAAGAVAIVVFVLGHAVGHHIDRIEAWITGMGPWALAAFIGLFVVMTSLLVPDTVLAITAGALFGPGLGLAAVLVATFLAAALQYTLSSRFLRARVEAMLLRRPPLAAIERAVKRDEFHLQVLLRLTPLNPATISYLLGAAGVRFWGFLLACLALTPSLFTLVWFGQAGWHIARVAALGGRVFRLSDAALLAGLAACIALLVFVSKRAYRALVQEISEDERENGDAEPAYPVHAGR